jgi:hypothetical protein
LEHWSVTRLKTRLVQEKDGDTVLTEELFQFQLPVANPVSVPASQSQGFTPYVLLCSAANLGSEEETAFRQPLDGLPLLEGCRALTDVGGIAGETGYLVAR